MTVQDHQRYGPCHRDFATNQASFPGSPSEHETLDLLNVDVTHPEANGLDAVHVHLLVTDCIAVSASYRTDLLDSGDFLCASGVTVNECRMVIVDVHAVKNLARHPANRHDHHDAGGCGRGHVLDRASTSSTLKMGTARDFCSAGVLTPTKGGISIDHHGGFEKHRSRQLPDEETVPDAAGSMVGHHAHATVPPSPLAPCVGQTAPLSADPSACLRKAPGRDCL